MTAPGTGFRLDIKREFPAALDAVDTISLQLRLDLTRYCSQADVFATEILCREALTNAVLHGCGLDSSKNVRFSVRARSDRIVLSVGDEGAGFDWRQRLGHAAGDDDESGRGVAIFKAYADRFRFNASGNAVTLIRRFSGEKK